MGLFARGFTLLIYASATVASGVPSRYPITSDANAKGHSIAPVIPEDNYNSMIHTFKPHITTWQQIYELTLHKPDCSQGIKHFDYVCELLKDLQNSDKAQKAFKHLDFLVEHHSQKRNTRDHYKLDIPYRNEVYGLRTLNGDKEHFTDAEMILAAYQVATEQANWIKKYGTKDLQARASNAHEKHKGSSNRFDMLIRYLENLSIGISEEIKQGTVGKYPDYGKDFNLNPAVTQSTRAVMCEFDKALATPHYIKNQEGQYVVPILNTIKEMMSHIEQKAYVDYFKTHKIRTCKSCDASKTVPLKKSVQNSYSHSIAETSATFLGIAGGLFTALWGFKRYYEHVLQPDNKNVHRHKRHLN